MGGWDWSGLGFVVELLGVDDVEQLIECMSVVRYHRPPEPGVLPL